MNLSQAQLTLLSDLGITIWRARPDQSALDGVATTGAQTIAEDESKPNPQGGAVQNNPAAQALAAIGENRPAPESTPDLGGSVSLDDGVEVAPNSPDASEDANLIEPIAFDWTRAGSVILLHDPQLDSGLKQFCRDLLLGVGWIVAEQADPDALKQNTSKYAQGEFRWPQLENSSGRPDRVLSAWWAKHVNESTTVVAVSSVIRQLVVWENLSTNQVFEIADLDEAMSQPQVKRALWQQLHR